MVRALLCCLLIGALLAPNPFADRRTADRVRPGSLPVETVLGWLANQDVHEPFVPESLVGLPSDLSTFLPADRPLTQAKVELGRQLFFDKRLSRHGQSSCATCHDPEFGWSGGRDVPVGRRPGHPGLDAPALVNLLLEESPEHPLEARTLVALTSPTEMHAHLPHVIERLQNVEGYRLQFAAIFGVPIDVDSISSALSAFQRTLLSGGSPNDYEVAALAFDDPAELEGHPGAIRHMNEVLDERERHRMSPQAEVGRALFQGQAGCTQCHSGVDLSDGLSHNTGIGWNAGIAGAEPDAEDSATGKYRTPSLRNVAATAPYMHDGSLTSLEDVIEYYDAGGRTHPELSEHLKPLGLDAQDKAALLAFLREGLAGKSATTDLPRLP